MINKAGESTPTDSSNKILNSSGAHIIDDFESANSNLLNSSSGRSKIN